MRPQYSLKEIEAFVLVAELGSFRDAARELRLTQSALTQRLKKLEDRLGARLIDRTTRAVAPTAVGSSFLPAATRLLAQFERSFTDLQDFIEVRHGRVTLASLISVATYILPHAISRFSVKHPDVSIRVIDDSEQDIVEYVRRGEAEFAIDMRTQDEGHDPSLTFTPVIEDRFVMACREDHPLAVGGPVQWDALAEMPVIMLGPRSGTSRLLASKMPQGQRRQHWRYEVQHLSTMMGFIEAGLGVGIVPAMAMREMDSRAIVHRPLGEPGVSRTLAIVERPDATLSPAAATLKAMLLDEFHKLEKVLAKI
ncbi:MAG: DNA-binding transcriptional LysR family regulator [Gammaproteobacteria bacterium]|jgi:DNA-binding transcriptional LysR family regulator